MTQQDTRLKLADFAGTWTIRREIRDFRAGSTLRFDGVAKFAGETAALVYVETGRVHLPDGHVLAASRRYLWRAVAAGIAVQFENGRPFHSFSLAGSRATATHHCDPDTYDVAYDFSQWPLWRATWRVSGPRKHYEMVSDYSFSG